MKPANFGAFEVAALHSEEKQVAISAPSTNDPDTDLQNVGAIAIYKKVGGGYNLAATVYGEEKNFKLGEKFLHFETEHDLQTFSANHESSYVSDVLVSRFQLDPIV